MVVLTILYNLGEQPMTVLEHTKFSLPSARDAGEAAFFTKWNA
jgi:hypothetical protein